MDPNGAISRAIEVHQQDTLPLPEHALAVMNRNCLAAPEQHREQMRVRLRRVQARAAEGAKAKQTNGKEKEEEEEEEGEEEGEGA